jgi:uncharacterized protein
VHFARGLRHAGLPIGSGQVMDALRAAEMIDLSKRDDFYWALASVLVDRKQQLELFDAAFRYFWERKPFERDVVSLVKPMPPEANDEVALRVLEAFAREEALSKREASDVSPERLDSTYTASREEQLQQMDFQEMSVEDIHEAKRMLARLRLPIPEMDSPLEGRFARNCGRSSRHIAIQSTRAE